MSAITESILIKYHHDPSRLMDILHEIQREYHHIPPESVKKIADDLKMSVVDVRQVISFYHFFTEESAGKYAVYLNNSVVAEMMGRKEVADTFENELGITFNSTTKDGIFGLWDTSDIGMNDQEPAAFINGVVFPRLTPSKVKEIVAGFKAGKSAQEMVAKYGDGENSHPLIKAMVHNNLIRRGAVLFTDYEVGMAIRKAVNMPPEHVVDEIKNSNLSSELAVAHGQQNSLCRGLPHSRPAFELRGT